MRSSSATSGARIRLGPLGIALALAVTELVVFSLAYKNGFGFTCQAPAPKWFCVFASRSAPSALGVLVALAVFALARRAVLADLLGTPGRMRLGLGLALGGFAVMMMPWALLSAESDPALVVPAALAGLAGGALSAAGLATILAAPAAWGRLVRRHWPMLGALVLLGILLPWLATGLKGVWYHNETLKAVTFEAVLWVLGQAGYVLEADPVERIIGADPFYVRVGPSCSGVEGFVLTTAFVALYLALFRRDLRFPHALVLLPLGLAASWGFNVIRISVLLVIGLEGNPALAAGAFHSHAGWLMFTLVALGIVALAHMASWLKKPAPAGPGPAGRAGDMPVPFWQDPVVARILPFAVFMLSALAASTFSQSPDTLYPLRALVLGAVVLAFLPVYRRLDWRLDPVALLAGATVGAMWVLVPVAPAAAPAYGALSGGLLLVWFVMRGLGTILLVPLVEELFFRDYLEGRLRLRQGRGWAILSALITAALFAMLHDRWAEAFAAGLVFSAVARRRGRIADAVLAHAAANAIVYAVAVRTGNLALI